jgi:hypothetical protein
MPSTAISILNNLFDNCSENVGLLGLTHIGSRRVVQISCGFMIFFSIFGTAFNIPLEFLFGEFPCTFMFLMQSIIFPCLLQENSEPFSHQFPYQYLVLYTVFYSELLVGVAAITYTISYYNWHIVDANLYNCLSLSCSCYWDFIYTICK